MRTYTWQKPGFFDQATIKVTMSAPIYLPVDQQNKVKTGSLQRVGWLLLGMFLGLLLVIALAAGSLAYLFVQSDQIFPGVSVYGRPLGGLTQADAVLALEDRWQQQPIELVGETAVWKATPTDLGMTLDATGSVRQAYAVGRSWSSLIELWQNGGQLNLAPIWQFDAHVAEQYLNRRAHELAVPPVEAGLRLISDEANAPRVEAIPAQVGERLAVAEILIPLRANPAGVLMSGQLQLVTETVTPTVTDVGEALLQANAWLAHPLSMTAYDPIRDERLAWEINPAQWSRWGQLAIDPATLSLNWVLDETAVLNYFNEDLVGNGRYFRPDELVTAIAQALANPPGHVHLRLFHQERQHVVQSGESFAVIGRRYGIPYPWIQQANPGVEALYPGQTLTIPSPDELLPLPVVENKRIVVSLSQQRVRVYENGSLKWDWLTSTGIDDSPTAPGVFQIQSHEPNAYAANWDLWMPYFLGVYRPVPTSQFMNGFHGFPTQGGSQILWTNSLGRRVTYGCILLSNENAILLYEWAEPGVVVEIQ
jgi:lipoprotein-anchoring transpeptidase ErfK/SrfK